MLTAALLLAGGLLIMPAHVGAERIDAGRAGEKGFATIASLQGTELFAAQDASQDIRLRTISYHGDRSNLMYLDFDQEVPELLRDQAGRYRIGEANYIFNADARHGRGAALFNRLENRVVIRSPEELWPGTGPSGDFTIEMWLKPIYFYRKNIIFRKLNMLEGKRRGLQIFVEDDRLYVHGENLFEDARGQLHSLRLGSRTAVRTQEWMHLSVSFEASKGLMRLFLNGEEETVAAAADKSGVWQMVFHPLDRSPIVLAETYAGALDEFRIARDALRPGDRPGQATANTTTYAPLRLDYQTMRGEQRVGTVVSEVLRPKSDARPGGVGDMHPAGFTARSGRVSYRASEPAGTILNFYVRASKQPFAKDTSERELPWRRLSQSGETYTLPMFSYFQWRAELQADPTGAHTPVLHDLSLDFVPLTPPPAPGKLKLVPGLEHLRRAAVLEWDQSPDSQVQAAGGGYYIYYGLRPGEYLGRLSMNAAGQPIQKGLSPERLATLMNAEERLLERSRPEQLRRSLRNRLRILIDNSLIQKNTSLNTAEPRLPFLHPNRVYYFAVSAYDAEGTESKLSNEVIVTIRPDGS
ncbi:MAG: LamG domain-containing protein [bacterium]|nr:LamG domain-containing protein [bacterium]